jgi:predicted nucleic acid-binding Zn ribbon protein
MDEDEDLWDDADATIPCPYCGDAIHEDSQRCPHCGNYISSEDVAPARKPWWIIGGTLAVLYIIYRWIAG